MSDDTYQIVIESSREGDNDGRNSNQYADLGALQSLTMQFRPVSSMLARSMAPAVSTPPAQRHSFQVRFFHQPLLCMHCSDYIWGEGYVGYACVKCSRYVHSSCKVFANVLCECKETTATSGDTLSQSSGADATLASRPHPYPVENWSSMSVKEWLACVNLHRYAEVFYTYNVDGVKLLRLDMYQLGAFRIRDSFHHQAILQCRDELIYLSRMYDSVEKMIREEDRIRDNLQRNQFKAEHHHFLLHTVHKPNVSCQMCDRPLLGIIHQGMQCQKCGLLVHRKCSSLGLPKCSTHSSRIFKPHHIFGVSLYELANSMSGGESHVPKFLIKLCTHIEQRAYTNNDDLYDAYRLSSDTNTLEPIVTSINENGIELINLDQFDLNTICSLVKAFLRDLQNSVIPEEVYFKLVDRIQTMSSDELKSLIKNSLDPVHMSCLRYIMSHLIRVWSYQFKVRGCHYLPDKLFHIFRIILLRPRWSHVISWVHNVENQSLVIQRLMLECEWGEPVPEYKIRPKRPANPVTQSSVKSFTPVVENTTSVVARSTSSSPVVTHHRRKNSYNKDNLIEMHWYWGNIDRDETLLVLKNCPDGSFIVRDSSETKTNAAGATLANASTGSLSGLSPYTLCVLKSGQVKSIRIFKQEQIGRQSSSNSINSISSMTSNSSLSQTTFYYDIEKPCRFETVSALIAYYSRVSLKEYNHNLDLVLTYGVSKFKFGKATEWSMDKLYSSYKDASDQHEKLMKKCEGLESDIGNVRDDLAQKKQALEAFDKIVLIYTTQAEQCEKVINKNLLQKTNAISSTRLLVSQLMPLAHRPNDIGDEEAAETDRLMTENITRLKERITMLHKKREELQLDIEYLNTIVHQLQEELDLLRPELVEFNKKRENYHMWLVQRGETDTKIQDKLQRQSKLDLDNMYLTSSSLSTDQTVDPHQDSTNWFRHDMSREDAIQALTGRAEGTYLVRSNSKPLSKYILSLVVQSPDNIKHILIEEDSSGCFLKSLKNDTSSPMPKFNTLTELVSFYSKNKLHDSNSIDLDTKLIHPVFLG